MVVSESHTMGCNKYSDLVVLKAPCLSEYLLHPAKEAPIALPLCLYPTNLFQIAISHATGWVVKLPPLA
jgi:hypothetical protein